MGRGRKDSAVLPVVVIEIILVSFFGMYMLPHLETFLSVHYSVHQPYKNNTNYDALPSIRVFSVATTPSKKRDGLREGPSNANA